MRVVTKKPLVEQILNDIAEAEKQNIEIDYIELTKDELAELKHTLYFKYYCNQSNIMNAIRNPTFYGYPIRMAGDE